MKRGLFLSLLLGAVCYLVAAGGRPALAQAVSNTVGVGSSPQLFATMCALDAAGFDANANTLEIYPADASLRGRLLEMKGPAVDAVRAFYKRHEFSDADETLSPFLAYALVVGPPPNFGFIVPHNSLPPSVLTIEGFSQVLSKFYAAADLEREWATVQPETDHEVARIRDPLRQVVFETTGYLRMILPARGDRTFTVLVEPLLGARVDFRNVGNHYVIMVGPGPVLPVGDIRHAFLHFLLDPLVLQNQAVILEKKVLLSVAARAPQLPPTYQNDFVGLFDECLVRAVELRMRHLTPDQLTKAVSDDDLTGFILVRPIYLELLKFEKAAPSMTFYFPNLVKGIDVGSELKRFNNFQFASASEKIAPSSIREQNPAALRETELNRELVRGDRQIATQDGAGAAATFQAILEKHPNLPRALYGLAIASVLQKQGEKAENLFEQLVSQPLPGENTSPKPAPDILAWSHVYLGRMYDLQGERKQALSEYQAALHVVGAPEEARVAARQGIGTPYHTPQHVSRQQL